MNINKLRCSGLIKPTKLYGKYPGVGRSFYRYDLDDILAGTALTDRTIYLPAPEGVGTDPSIYTIVPTSIHADGCSPSTFVVYIDKLEENLLFDPSALMGYFRDNEMWSAQIDIWVKCTTPTATKGVWFHNGETLGYTWNFGTLEYVRIHATMSKREWEDPTGADANLMPTYRRPRL